MLIKPSKYNPPNMRINTSWRFSTFSFDISPRRRPRYQGSLVSESAYTRPGWLGTVVAPSGFPNVALRRFMTGFPNIDATANSIIEWWLLLRSSGKIFQKLEENTPWFDPEGFSQACLGHYQSLIKMLLKEVCPVHLYKEKVTIGCLNCQWY